MTNRILVRELRATPPIQWVLLALSGIGVVGMLYLDMCLTVYGFRHPDMTQTRVLFHWRDAIRFRR